MRRWTMDDWQKFYALDRRIAEGIAWRNVGVDPEFNRLAGIKPGDELHQWSFVPEWSRRDDDALELVKVLSDRPYDWGFTIDIRNASFREKTNLRRYIVGTSIMTRNFIEESDSLAEAIATVVDRRLAYERTQTKGTT